jgi:hypothetical protein
MPTIGAYVVTYASDSSQPWTAEIRCFAELTVPPGPEAAAIRFFPEGAQRPPSDNVAGVPVINFPLAAFADVITILRSEQHISADKFFYTSPGASVDCWGVSGGIAPVADMNP